MNRRKAKKQIKKKWRIRRWHGNDTPREVDRLLREYTEYLKRRILEEMDHAILYGSGDGGLHIMPQGFARRLWE